LGAIGGNGATSSVAVSGGSDAIVRAIDDSGAISDAAATGTGTMLGAAAGSGTTLGDAMGDGSVTCAAAARDSARATGFVAVGAFARISGALPKAPSASQVAVIMTATTVVSSIPQPSARRG
jgi:hypothetical protein